MLNLPQDGEHRVGVSTGIEVLIRQNQCDQRPERSIAAILDERRGREKYRSL